MDAALAIDAPMHDDPALEAPPTRIEFNPRLKTLWLAALDRPEIDLRLHAADAIGKAFQQGYTDLADTAPKLAAMLGAENHPLVRLALAEALIRLDAKDHAAALWEANQQGDRDMILLTDPALARWKYAGAGQTWNDRVIGNPHEPVPNAIRRSAIAALGKLADPRFDAPAGIANDQQMDPALRVQAARAMAESYGSPAGVSLAAYESAQRLQKGSEVDRLIGVLWLRRSGDAGLPDLRPKLWLEFAADPSPVVVAEALDQLRVIGSGAVLRIQPSPMASADANVRLAAARCLSMHNHIDAIRPLAAMLGDHDPSTRHFARFALLQFDADAAKRDAVCAAAMDVLASSEWRALEQAALLLGKLDHEPAAGRLLELLTHERTDVRVAAAVALRWLAVPEVPPALLQHAQALTKADTAALSPGQRTATTDQLVQIFQTFGVVGYREAEPLMRTFIPKGAPYASTARAAAIWTLGKFYAGASDDGLARQLQGRLSDTNPLNPEATEVRSASAVALGRMKSHSATATLQKFLQEENGSQEIGGACKWALEQIGGKPLPPLDTLVERPTDWFLRPVE